MLATREFFFLLAVSLCSGAVLEQAVVGQELANSSLVFSTDLKARMHTKQNNIAWKNNSAQNFGSEFPFAISLVLLCQQTTVVRALLCLSTRFSQCPLRPGTMGRSRSLATRCGLSTGAKAVVVPSKPVLSRFLRFATRYLMTSSYGEDVEAQPRGGFDCTF